MRTEPSFLDNGYRLPSIRRIGMVLRNDWMLSFLETKRGRCFSYWALRKYADRALRKSMMALLNAFDGIGLSLSHPFAFFMPVTFGYSGFGFVSLSYVLNASTCWL